MKINISMLLLFLIIVNNFVLTKVQIIPNTRIFFGTKQNYVISTKPLLYHVITYVLPDELLDRSNMFREPV